MLYGELLTSPHAHARIIAEQPEKASAARRACRPHTRTCASSTPAAGELQTRAAAGDLDSEVRHVGDRVAILSGGDA